MPKNVRGFSGGKLLTNRVITAFGSSHLKFPDADRDLALSSLPI